MDRLLGITHRSSVSVRCRMGAFDICQSEVTKNDELRSENGRYSIQ